MSFINEYVSEEDTNKYGLEKILFRYNPIYRNHSLPAGFRYMWTIDHERNIYFFNVDGHPGAPEYGTRHILNWDGKELMIRLGLPGEGSKSYAEDPYIIVWDLLQIKPDSDKNLTRQTIIQVLKEALTTYGDQGINSYVTNTIVKFKF